MTENDPAKAPGAPSAADLELRLDEAIGDSPAPVTGDLSALIDSPEAPGPPESSGWGLPLKTALLAAILTALAGVCGGWLAVHSLDQGMRAELVSKGEAVARSLANSTYEPSINGDLDALDALARRFAGIDGVAYVLIEDPAQKLVAHSFPTSVPESLLDANRVAGEADSRVENLTFEDPTVGRRRRVLDVASPVLTGQLGTARVGVDEAPARAAIRRFLLQLAALLGLLTLGAAFAGSWLARGIVRPIARMIEIARQVARGNLADLTNTRARGEIGDLAWELNNAIVKLRHFVRGGADERVKRQKLEGEVAQLAASVRGLSNGDLSRRGEPVSEELAPVTESINALLEGVGKTLSGFGATAEGVNARVGDLVSENEGVAAEVRSLRNNADRLGNQLEELFKKTRELSESASATGAAGRRTAEAAEKGRSSVKEALERIEDAREGMVSAEAGTRDLGEGLTALSRAVKAASRLSSQTNLKALNSAIDAAAAGPATAAFSQRADELRRLAEDSARENRRVAALVADLAPRIEAASAALVNGAGSLEAGIEGAREAERAIAEISRISATSADLAKRIFETSQQLGDGEGLSKSSTSIRELARKTEESANAANLISHEIRSQTRKLKDRLALFRTGE